METNFDKTEEIRLAIAKRAYECEVLFEKIYESDTTVEINVIAELGKELAYGIRLKASELEKL